MPDITINECRPEVQAFAVLMEERLREKDAERGLAWKGVNQKQLGTALITKAIETDRTGETKHAVDVANYAMMMVDVVGGL